MLRFRGKAKSDGPAGEAVDAGSIRVQLQKVLGSKEFASATRLQQFLAFVVEETLNGAGSIKETELAVRVFNRRQSFDPTGDSIVRVAATNLRHRLQDYYQNTGLHDPVIIVLPKGSYVPVSRFRGLSAGASAPRRSFARRGILALSVGVFAAVAALTAWLLPAPRTPVWTSIAVLPFLNLGGDPAGRSSADVFVEDLTDALAQDEHLHVVARSSAFQFRDKHVDARVAGRQLGVEVVVEGSVRVIGNRLRISTQLINVTDGFHLWSRNWECESADILGAGAKLAKSVTAALQQVRLAQSATRSTVR